MKEKPLELSDDWENNLYRNIVHTLAETEGMIPGGQAERIMVVCDALYEVKIQQAKAEVAREIFEILEEAFRNADNRMGLFILSREWQSLKDRFLKEVK